MRNEFFEGIKEGLIDAIAWMEGEEDRGHVSNVKPLNVKALRKKLGMTQRELSEIIGSPIRTIRAWEQEKDSRYPTRPTQKLLMLLDKYPAFIEEVRTL